METSQLVTEWSDKVLYSQSFSISPITPPNPSPPHSHIVKPQACNNVSFTHMESRIFDIEQVTMQKKNS